MFPATSGRVLAPRLAFSSALWAACLTSLASAQQSQQPLTRQGIVHKIEAPTERLEMVVNTSRILTLGDKIPQVQVNNQDIVGVEPLSPTQVQLFAKKAGVTQVNLWDDKEQLHTIDVVVFGDSQELQLLLESQFPNSALKVFPLANSVVISGYVEDLNQVDRITEMAKDYYPKVINNITVGGVQQVMLHVKVLEISRTKVRNLGIDWAEINGDDFVTMSIGGLLQSFSNTSGELVHQGTNVTFGIVDPNNSFFGFIDALQRKNLARLISDPTLTTVSGRPAFFNEGGEFPILVPQSLGTVSIEWKKFGTQMDFVPIVLGNGAIRLEIRPRVSEIDDSRSVQIQDINVPGLRVREADTGVEMRAGQTLAIAGLIQQRTEAEVRAIPLLGELPYVGVMFSRKREQTNEIELLILVTPELVEPMDCDEVPPCGPGTMTTMPTDWQWYVKNHIEVPKCCPDGTPYPINGAATEGMMPQGETVPPGAPAGMMPAQSPPPGGEARATDQVRPGTAQMQSPRTPTVRGPVVQGAQSRATAPINRQTAQNPPRRSAPQVSTARPGLIGPTGYDDVE